MDKHCILIVDDEVNTLIVFKGFLETDYEVYTAENAERALEIFKNRKVDLVIADQRMPGMSGVDMLCRMKEINPDNIRIILTAYADFSAVLKAVNEGDVYRFILKPWNLEEMSLTLRQALDHLESIRARERLLKELMEKNRELEKTTMELQKARDSLVELEKLAVVGKMAGTLVHEISNYVTGMMFVERLEEKYGDDKEVRVFAEVVKNLTETVTSMLEVYRFHTRKGGQLRFRKRSVHLNELIENVISFAGRTSVAKGRNIVFRPESSVICRVDRQKLKQVLINLIKNAVHASGPDDKIEIVLSSSEDRAIIEVSDEGTGIPSEMQKNVWEPFFTTKGDEGLGLGLDICKTYIEGHGGTIDLKSTPGEGSVFTIVLPVE